MVSIAHAWVAVQFLTVLLPDSDRVEVYHIQDLRYGENGRHQIPENVAERFVLETQGGHTVARVMNRKELTGVEAKEFVRLWRGLVFGAKYQHLCHQPGYGLRFHSGAKVRFDTTLCFECMNFPVRAGGRGGFYGFNAKHPSAETLLQKLQAYFPASVPKPRRPTTEKQAGPASQSVEKITDKQP